MISRNGKENFLAAHYEWIVAAVGLLALVAGGAFFATTLGEDPDEARQNAEARVRGMKRAETGVETVDMSAFAAVTRLMRVPAVVSEVSDKQASFLASEKRVKCKKCGKAIPGDVKAFPTCPACGEAQEVEAVVVLDADKDGLPDEWEKKVGLNPAEDDADADKDGDGFTNMEEFQAKTDPSDAKSHPAYLDALKLTLPLNETYLPFVFRKANKIPSGWRLEFLDPKQKDNYGRMGLTITAVLGQEIGKSGFVAKSYEQKSEKRAIAGSKNTKSVDVSEATVERKGDGKLVKLVIQEGKAIKPVPVDVQAKLEFARAAEGQPSTFEVVAGSEIDLRGEKYKVVEIKAAGKGAKVTLEDSATGVKRTLDALE